MNVETRLSEAIGFCLTSKPNISLEEIGREYVRRSPSGATVAEASAGRSIKDWVTVELADKFRVTEGSEEISVEYVPGALRHKSIPISLEDRIDILSNLRIGTGIAERSDDAGFSFVPTRAWRSFVEDSHDIFVGSKGSGKSQLLRHALSLGMNEITRNVRLVHIDAAKDQYLLPPRVVLKKLSIEAHKGIWLLLLAMKAYLWCKQYSIKFDISEIETILLETGFLENNELTGRSNKIVSFFVELSRRVEFSAKAEIEGVGFVEFRPSGSEEEVDSAALMRRAERTCIKFLTSLVTEQRIWLWFAIDRTDILFDGDQNLESQSLYALLSILRDDIGSNSADFGFKTKLFLKSEVWSELSKQGIPEFSHLVARRTELIWTLYELQRVIAGRFAANQNLMEAMIYDKSSALKNRYSVEDFMIQLLPEKLIPDRGGGRKPKDWILQTLRDSTGLPTPRDYIQYFRKVIDYERDQVEREGGTGWRHRNLFQQESLIMGGKLLAIEKLHIMVSELPALQPLLDYVKKNARRVLTPENYLEAMGERGREEISRFLSSGILRPMLLNDNCEIPWFFFDALVSRERQMSSGYEVPDAKSSKFKAEIEKTLTTREFIQCVYQKVDGNEVVNYGGKRIRLPTESLLSIRSTIKEGGGAIKFWINVLRQGTWILDSTRPLIIEQTYDFKIGGWNGNDHNLALCVDERLGQELEIAAQGFLVSNVGIVLKGVVADIGQKFPICVPEPIDM